MRVGVVGKYIGLQDAYKSVYEAIIHGGIAATIAAWRSCRVDAEEIEKDGAEKMLHGLGGILVPEYGFGERGVEGKIPRRSIRRVKVRINSLSWFVPGNADRYD